MPSWSGGSGWRGIPYHSTAAPLITVVASPATSPPTSSASSPTVWAAMEQMNRHYVRMVDLLERSGESISGMLGAEAALWSAATPVELVADWSAEGVVAAAAD